MSEAWETRYRLNHTDAIVDVDEGWVRFANENDGSDLTVARVLLRPLWDFIADEATAAIYRAIVRRARSGQVVRLQFRCDAPACRRLMQMEVAGSPDGNVEFRTRTVEETPRPAQPLLSPFAARSDEQLLMCGWCNRMRVGEDWLEAEDAAATLRLFERPALPALSHGICATCKTTVMTAAGLG